MVGKRRWSEWQELEHFPDDPNMNNMPEGALILGGQLFFSPALLKKKVCLEKNESSDLCTDSHMCYKEGKVTSKYFSFILNSLTGYVSQRYLIIVLSTDTGWEKTSLVTSSSLPWWGISTPSIQCRGLSKTEELIRNLFLPSLTGRM